MIIVEKGVLINPENVAAKLEEAREILKHLKGALDFNDINTIIENMAKTELDKAIALGSLHEDMPINEFIVKKVDSEGEVKDVQDNKTASLKSKISLAKRREIARKAARTRKANPAKAKESEEKRQQARSNRRDLGVGNNE